MPSGDAAQGSLFIFFLTFHFPYLFMAMGGYNFTIKFITLVSIGRVFHHCHFFGDTLVGALIGFVVAASF